jgi:hypothetical protein
MRTLASSVFALAACGLASVACNGGNNTADGATHNPLNVTAPYPLTDVSGSVRNVVVTARGSQRQANETALCTLEAYLFDPAMPNPSLMPTAMSGECALYPAGAMINLRAQTWVCAGAISASYGQQQMLSMCPAAGANPAPSIPVDCAGLSSGATVTISSGNELPGMDVVTDLNATVTFPGDIMFSQPTTLGVASWPMNGDVPVAWSGPGATAAVVVVEARTMPSASPSIVCRPHTNGQATIPDSLLTQSGLRSMNSMIRVFSYGDATTTAEMGHTYHLFAGLEAAVYMNPF